MKNYINNDPDKFGFYQVGNKKTYSKYEALEWGEPIWNFNDEIFSIFDWTKEPETDLWTLYKQRCEQIRRQYDYCVLFYSGGSDSHNILNAWLETGLPLDEIATFWDYPSSEDQDNFINAEVVKVVLPHIKQLKEKIKFKFRLIDLTSLSLKAFDVLGHDIEYNCNYHVRATTFGTYMFRTFIKEYRDIIDSGKKLCFIWGKEKPTVSIKNGNFYFNFIDNNLLIPFSSMVIPYTVSATSMVPFLCVITRN